MATVKIEESKIIQAYKGANDETKKLLEEMFKGYVALKPSGKINTVEDAFKHLGREIPSTDYEKLCGVIEAFNNGRKPNWNDTDESKFYIWWNMQSSDFGVYAVFNPRYSATSLVPSRLCFRERKDAEYCAKQFEDLWRKVMLIED